VHRWSPMADHTAEMVEQVASGAGRDRRLEASAQEDAGRAGCSVDRPVPLPCGIGRAAMAAALFVRAVEGDPRNQSTVPASPGCERA